MAKLLLLLIFGCFTFATADDDRLPLHITPINYNLTIKADLHQSSYEGLVKIDLKVLKPSTSITLHAEDLNIYSKTITLTDGVRNIPVKKVLVETTPNFYIIVFENTIYGTYRLSMRFQGKFSKEINGFFLKHYTSKNQDVPFAATQFQFSGARRMFPCFDNPGFKTTFDITVIHDKEFSAKSNMPIKTETTTGSLTSTVFERTPVMSTYLVAVLISKFDHLSNKAGNMTVWGRPEFMQKAEYVRDVGQKVWKLLEEYTGISNGIPKVDQVALPSFFDGAMENWGLVFYKERALQTGRFTKEDITTLIAHELAHHWFGNLVTAKWWNYLWLNEGFATYIQNYITDKIEPSWRIIDNFIIHMESFAFPSEDNVKWEKHPINMDVENGKEADEANMQIIYLKGASIIRMMEHFITDKVLRQGLQYYLRKHAYKSVESDDLFSDLNEILRKNNISLPADLKVIMQHWVDGEGYPLVTVERNYETGSITIRQETFYQNKILPKPHVKSNPGIPSNWWIPVNYASQSHVDFNDTSAMLWLNPSNDETHINAGLKNDEWLILNKQFTGYYRVNYDERNWKMIANYLNSENREKIHILNRAQLIYDATAFLKKLSLNPISALELAKHMAHETDYIAWFATFRMFDEFENLLHYTKHYGSLMMYFKNLIMDLNLNFKGETVSDVEESFRIEALKWSCKVGAESCKVKLAEVFYPWLENKSSNTTLPYDTLCAAMRDADAQVRQKLITKAAGISDYRFKEKVLKSLGCSYDSRFLADLLQNSNSANPLLKTYAAVEAVLENTYDGMDIVLDYLVKNPSVFGSYLTDLETKIRTQEQSKKFQIVSFAFEGRANWNLEGVFMFRWLSYYEDQIGTWLMSNILPKANE